MKFGDRSMETRSFCGEGKREFVLLFTTQGVLKGRVTFGLLKSFQEVNLMVIYV